MSGLPWLLSPMAVAVAIFLVTVIAVRAHLSYAKRQAEKAAVEHVGEELKQECEDALRAVVPNIMTRLSIASGLEHLPSGRLGPSRLGILLTVSLESAGDLEVVEKMVKQRVEDCLARPGFPKYRVRINFPAPTLSPLSRTESLHDA